MSLVMTHNNDAHDTPILSSAERLFLQSALRAFSFLASDYGFSLRTQSAGVLCAESRHLVIRFILEYEGPHIEMERMRSIWAAIWGRKQANCLSLYDVITRLAPNAQIRTEWGGGRDVYVPEAMIPEYFEYMGGLVRRYCSSFLEGRFDTWPG